MRILRVASVALLAFGGSASGQGADDVMLVRVVDTGAGLCCLAKIPTGDANDPWDFVVYDAGYYSAASEALTMQRLGELTGSDDVIDCLILSHTDADHNGAVRQICETYHVKRIVHSGYLRPDLSSQVEDANAAIAEEVAHDGAIEWNLDKIGHLDGEWKPVGKARLTFVCGFSTPPANFEVKPGAEFNNAGSIVARLTYKRKSVLLTGDAVGRHSNSPDDLCIATERFMVENADDVPVRADVLVAPHHGANNASSPQFIQAVKPVWVIFSAGHQYEHPRLATVNRYRAAGIPDDHLLRTDRGDDEPGSEDWASTDPRGDAIGRDDVDITITPQGGTKAGIVAVGYRVP
jgi:beta-lactamase superfamily II metal-dependent hydrolase